MGSPYLRRFGDGGPHIYGGGPYHYDTGQNLARVKNASSAGYKFGHLILHTYKGYELTIPVNHNPLYVLAAVGNLGASVVPFRNRSYSHPVAE